MADKFKLSKKSSDELLHLSTRLKLRRNIVCRMAMGYSLSIQEPVLEEIFSDSEGYEFNKPTILGLDELPYKAMSAMINGHSISDDIFFNIIVRNHIERGLDGLSKEYQRINSPTDFMQFVILYND